LDKKSLTRSLILSHGLMLLILTVLVFLHTPIWILLAIMVLVTGIIIWRISHSLHKQYELISKVAIQIAQGDHSIRIPDLESDEINVVGKDLNKMLIKLDKTIHHLAVHREELRLVLSSIEDVLWSQNLDGKLEWANSAFKELFTAYDPHQKQFYWDVIREPLLIEQIKDSAHSSDKLMRELQLGEHSFLLSGTHNVHARRRVFILQNIDDIRAAEQMKKDFVVNLAHELRTPLTAIKGFTEVMQEKPRQDNSRYLKIIHNHSNRLIHLIADLEQLIRLERIADIETTEIELRAFFENIKLIISPFVEEKGLQLLVELDPCLPHLACDPFKFEQVFINLVQNSLRYTDKGVITIRSTALNKEALFEVSDTGKGIEAKHLPRIFERFYVADPARNKSNSGTGLGLAIVKHIVLLHHGKISVSSELGKGTTFQIRIPNLLPIVTW